MSARLVLVTRASERAVYGRDVTDVDTANDCGGLNEIPLLAVDAIEVEVGHVYELSEAGSVVAEIVS